MKRIRIEDFNGIKVELEYKKIVNKYADRTKNILTAISPHTDRPNRTTPYRTGWTVNIHDEKEGYEAVVWNETNWQLTHLLENGHFITNGYNRTGLIWVQPKKHIRPAYETIRNPFKSAMKKMPIHADFK